jgi:uncharacterized membrane protein
MTTSLATAFLFSLLIGVIAGLRAMTAPAALSWAARTGWINVALTSLAFLAYAFTPWILTLPALAELVTDQLPTTPSRKAPGPFGARMVSGAVSGAAIGASRGALLAGLIAGILGAVIGTVGGQHFVRGSPRRLEEIAQRRSSKMPSRSAAPSSLWRRCSSPYRQCSLAASTSIVNTSSC